MWDISRHSWRSSSTTLLLALLPIAAPTAYLIYLRRSISRHVKSSTMMARQPTTSTSPSAPSSSSNAVPISDHLPSAIPEDVARDTSEYILSCEHVTSHPITSDSDTSSLLTTYMRTTMKAFSWTPQAFAMRALINDEARKQTFDKEWIENMNFVEGEHVNGLYKVVYRGDGGSGDGAERVELMPDAPASYKGPVVKVIIVAEVKRCEGVKGEKREGERRFMFVNETWLWRKRDEKPVMLETAIGKWIHSLVAGWLVFKGVSAVIAE